MAGLIGNVLEWFDFAVYGYFASDIGRHFFSGSSPATQQMLAFAVFALGFFAATVRLPLPSVVAGIVVGILTSMPDAIITKSYGPILGTGVVFGAIAGWVVGRWAVPAG